MDARDRNGLTAVSYAVTPLGEGSSTHDEGQRFAIVQLLKAHGADLDAHAKDGDTPLSSAAASGYASIVRYLIAQGADVDNQTDSGDTSLMAAVRLRRSAVVSILLDAGADRNLKNENGDSAITLARKAHETRLLALLSHRTGSAAGHGH